MPTSMLHRWTPATRGQRRTLVVIAVLVLLVLLVVFFPWDMLRPSVNRYVSDKTGRPFEITRRLDVRIGRDTRIVLDGVVFANPGWATEKNLVEAERAEFTVRLWPLIRHRRLELPQVFLSRPRLGLEMLPDGRKTWSLQPDGRGDGTIEIGTLQVDQGRVRFISPDHGADVRAAFAIDAARQADSAADLPLSFRGGGRWRGQGFVAEGRTGDVLALRESLQRPFPARVAINAGNTSLQASGAVSNLATFEGADLDVHVRGRNLADLSKLASLTLPSSPPYELRGHLRRSGTRWETTQLAGVIGRSDIAGALTYDASGKVGVLSGELASRRLDFDDLGPLIGAAPPATGAAGKQQARRKREAGGRVLPDAPLDLAALRRMDADVRIDAARVVNVQQLPIERIATRVKLQDARLQLDPLDLGVAGGKLVGAVRIDAEAKPADVRIQLNAQGLQLQKLLPAVDLNRASIGSVHGSIDLHGKGNSVAQMLGSASGHVQLLAGRGRISNLLLEIAGLDGGEVAKFLMGRDQRVDLRCAAVAFDVERGLMTSRALVLDTTDTVITGQGTINLADEQMDLIFRPEPKDKSILSLRTPLRLTGTLGAPDAGLQKGPLLARGAAALALAAINPLLALAATIETGPGKDADCTAVLKEASTPRVDASAAKPGQQAQQPQPQRRAGNGAAGR